MRIDASLTAARKFSANFVIAGRDATELLDAVEEALDGVARLVEVLREADGIAPVGLWRDVGPGLLFAHSLAQGVCVVAFVRQQHGPFGQIGDQPFRAGNITPFDGGWPELDRAALAVDERVDLGCEAASGAAQTAISTPLLAVAPC